MAVTPVALSGDVFAVVILVLLVIGGFFCVCDVCFVFRSFRTSEQRGKKIKISLRWKQLIVGYKCVCGTVH